MASVVTPAGLVHQVLGVFAAADTWRGDPVNDAFQRILDTIDPTDARIIPAAVGECLLALRGDPPQLRLALDVVRAFHLHEAWHGLVVLLREAPTDLAWSTAAALSTPRPLAPELHRLVRAHLAGANGSASDLRVALEGVPGEGSDDVARALIAERWPGRVPISDAVAMLVTVIDGSGDPADEFRLLLELRRAGAQVRRLPPGLDKPPHGWLPDWGVLVVAFAPPAWYPRRWPEPIRTRGDLAPAARRELLRRIRRRGKGHLRIAPPSSTGEVTAAPLPDPFEDADAFFQGALSPPEAAFFVGFAGDTLRRKGREPSLGPRLVGTTPYFDFAQLTAFRIEAYILHELHRRPQPRLAATIVEKSRSRHAVPISVTVEGEVLFEEGDQFVAPDGQTSWREGRLSLGDVARSFTLGSGCTVRELLAPSEHTEVHPAVQRGLPRVAGTRITATAVRDVFGHGRDAGHVGDELTRYVQRHYDLSAAQLRDAGLVGAEILG